MCGVCAEACDRCVSECEKHDNDHCKRCAASCCRDITPSLLTFSPLLQKV
ncbi:MAG: hypothetical protein KME50_02645 [Nostoc desertorum CM1-VF14]|nr:hypothetical protein [Nostoc desertorum CM1-VF14]